MLDGVLSDEDDDPVDLTRDAKNIQQSSFKDLSKFEVNLVPQAHKQEITAVIICRDMQKANKMQQYQPGQEPIVFVTTSLDGFIKQHSAQTL